MLRSTSSPLSMGLRSLAAALLLAAIVAPDAAAAGETRNAPPPKTSGRLATVVGVGRGGVTYRLPSGLRVLVGSRGAHVDTPHGYVHFRSTGTVVTGSGVVYHMTVEATRVTGGGGRPTVVSVILARERQSASTSATQLHVYLFQLAKGALAFSPDGPLARLSTGDGLGSWGSMRFHFRSERPPTERCGGAFTSWHGSSVGAVSFTPQGDNGFFGTIERSRFRKSVLTFRQSCGHSSASPDRLHRPCPKPNTLLYGDGGSFTRSVQILGLDRNGRRHKQYLVQQIAADPALVIHQVEAESNDAAVRHGPNGTATMEGFSGSFLTGTADFDPHHRKYRDGPHGCRGGHTFTAHFRPGKVLGERGDPFTAAFDTGAVSLSVMRADALYSELDWVVVR